MRKISKVSFTRNTHPSTIKNIAKFNRNGKLAIITKLIFGIWLNALRKRRRTKIRRGSSL